MIAPDYHAPAWLPGGHLQTIWPALFSRAHAVTRAPPPARTDALADTRTEAHTDTRTDTTAATRPAKFRRERWTAPDGDFVDVDFLADTPPGAACLVMFHGLEGSSGSPYAHAFADIARRHGLAFAVPHFRGCSGELNHGPRAYHSGDFEEIGWILQRLRARTPVPLLAVGISLGGNALLRWAEEAGASAAVTARAVASMSSPIDLTAGGHAIGSGLNRLIYTPWFLRTMKPKALAKLVQHPGLFSRERLLAARTLYEFDDVFTAPLHGFRDTDDYWLRASAKPQLAQIRIPALVLNARNDPFVPASSLPGSHEVGSHVTLWQPAHGGHVGFPRGAPPGPVLDMPEALFGWMNSR